MNSHDMSQHSPRLFSTGAVKTVATLVTTGALMALGLGAAAAHVSVTPESTSEGSFTELTFRVPSESEDALTEKVEVKLPTETPFTSLRALPVEGWTAEIVRGELPEPVTIDGTEITEGPLSVIWTANDEEHALSADEYQKFSLSVGRLPEAGTTVTLPLSQSYTDGSVSNWDQPTEEGGEEPEDPAPFFVTTAGGTDHGPEAEATEETATESAEEPAATEQASTTSSTSPVTWVALAAGLIGLAAGVFALMRSGKARAS